MHQQRQQQQERSGYAATPRAAFAAPGPSSSHSGSGFYKKRMSSDEDTRAFVEPLAFQTFGADAVEVDIDIVALFSPPSVATPRGFGTGGGEDDEEGEGQYAAQPYMMQYDQSIQRNAAVDVDMKMSSSSLLVGGTSPSHNNNTANGDFHFDFGRHAKAGAEDVVMQVTTALGPSSPSPSDASTSTMTSPKTTGHTSSGTDSEHMLEAAQFIQKTKNSNTAKHKGSTRRVSQQQSKQAVKLGKEGGSGETNTATTSAVTQEGEPEEDLLEVRRKRNRESMRRVRLRKRDAKLSTQQTIDELEAKLQQLMEKNQHAAIQLANSEGSDGSGTLLTTNNVPIGKPSYPELLSETASLSYENKHLRDNIKTFQVFEATIARMIDDDRLQQKVLSEEEVVNDDAEILRPLLSWLTPQDLTGIIDLAMYKIQENKALIESIVHRPNNALGWSDQRCIEGLMARYLLRKTFFHETVESLAHKTWETIVDIEKLAKVMRWANGMKILRWLSDDAAVVSRELTIPNPNGSDFPTRFRFTLLVFRRKTEDGGYCIGTINLNIYGTNVDECLQKDVTYKNGLNAHTMYGWSFSRARHKDTGEEIGCHVELAGLTGNGTYAYAHNVLMEMLTVVLLWENAFVASIKLLKT